MADIYECYEPREFKGEALERIIQARQIIEDYATQGYTLSLRQLYYQFVSRGLIPNTEQSYKSLGDLVTKGRMSGDLPWDGTAAAAARHG